jgi:hypothetical protein
MKLFLKELTLINQLDGRRAFRLDQLKKKPSHDDLKNWVKSGWLKRIAHGVYRIATLEPPDPMVLAALVVPDSYVTGMTALEYHGLVEADPTREIHSAIKGRKRRFTMEGKSYRFQRIGYTQNPGGKMSPTGHFSVATMETAILDLHYRNSVELKIPEGFIFEAVDLELLWSRSRQLAPGWRRWLLVRLHFQVKAELRRRERLVNFRHRRKSTDRVLPVA